MTTRIEVNVQTGEQITIKLSTEELAKRATEQSALDIERAEKQAQLTQDEVIAALISRIAALEAK